MSNLNKVFLLGNLTRDPELRQTANGASVCNFSIAVNEGFGDKKKVNFFNVQAWQKTAEACAKYLSKGRPVLVEGRLQNRSYEKDGQKRTITEIVAENVQFLAQAGRPEPAGQNDGIGSGGDCFDDNGGGDAVPF